jgi:hypothetical protein
MAVIRHDEDNHAENLRLLRLIRDEPAWALARVKRAAELEAESKVLRLERQLAGAVGLLREVADSGALLVDERLRWVEVQIDRETWDAVKAYGTPGGQS